MLPFTVNKDVYIYYCLLWSHKTMSHNSYYMSHMTDLKINYNNYVFILIHHKVAQ